MGDDELIQEVRDIASCADYPSTRKALFTAAKRLASLTSVSEDDVERVAKAIDATWNRLRACGSEDLARAALTAFVSR